MKTLAAILAPLVFIGLLLAGWEAACRLLAVPSYFLPAPSAIGQALAENLPLLARSGWNTLTTALWALLTASLLASLLALAAGLSGLVERAIQPVLVTLQVTPVIAIAPLVTIWAGLEHPERAVIGLAAVVAFFPVFSGALTGLKAVDPDLERLFDLYGATRWQKLTRLRLPTAVPFLLEHPERAVIGLAAVVAFFPVFSGALTGLKAVDPDLERLFDLYGATRWQKLTRLRLPTAVPFLLEGHKVAAGLAVVGAVVAEFGAGSGGSQGLAWRILEASNRLQTAKAFAALLVLAVMGATLYAILQLAERRALVWWRGR